MNIMYQDTYDKKKWDESNNDDRVDDDIKKFIIIINNNNFKPEFLYLDLQKFTDSKDYSSYKKFQSFFIDIIYRTPTIYLNSLTFETPWMRIVEPIIVAGNPEFNDNRKFFIELSFLEEDVDIIQFKSIMKSIDSFTTNFLLRYKDSEILSIKNVNDIYSQNIKKSILNDKQCYEYIKTKIDLDDDNIQIDVNNQRYNGEIKDLQIQNTYAKCWISTQGLWRYGNKCSYTWKINKIMIVDS